MNFIQKNWKGILVCLVMAVPCWLLGQRFPIVGGPVFGILAGMIVTLLWHDKSAAQPGISFVSKKVLQYAVILLGFGMNLSVIWQTGKQSLPIILVTITTSLVVAWLLHKLLHIPGKISTLVGVGSSICGGSAVAATASVIDADDEEVAQAISVIFFFNMLAAIFFPALGALLGFSTTNGEAFGIFAGTAINDTSSVTAAASTWDSLYGLGSQTLDKAVTVKLTRTLAIIPITLVLAFVRTKRAKTDGTKVDFKKIFPMFILYFLLASVVTTICVSAGVSASVFTPLKTLSKFLIVMAMCAVGLNTNIVKLVKTGGKPLIMGFCCWVGIAGMSLLMQHVLGISGNEICKTSAPDGRGGFRFLQSEMSSSWCSCSSATLPPLMTKQTLSPLHTGSWPRSAAPMPMADDGSHSSLPSRSSSFMPRRISSSATSAKPSVFTATYGKHTSPGICATSASATERFCSTCTGCPAHRLSV